MGVSTGSTTGRSVIELVEIGVSASSNTGRSVIELVEMGVSASSTTGERGRQSTAVTRAAKASKSPSSAGASSRRPATDISSVADDEPGAANHWK